MHSHQSRSCAVSGRDRLCQGRLVWRWTRWTTWQEWWSCSRDQVTKNIDKGRVDYICYYLKKMFLNHLSEVSVRATCFPPRYFQCLPRYGLFAPVHKVTRIGFPCTTPTKANSSRRRSTLKRSPSASSISSLSSATSSISGKPSRAGLVRLTLCCHLNFLSNVRWCFFFILFHFSLCFRLQ